MTKVNTGTRKLHVKTGAKQGAPTAVLRIRSILNRIRIRPTDLRPDPDPACNITGGEKKIDNTFRKMHPEQSWRYGTKKSWV